MKFKLELPSKSAQSQADRCLVLPGVTGRTRGVRVYKCQSKLQTPRKRGVYDSFFDNDESVIC